MALAPVRWHDAGLEDAILTETMWMGLAALLLVGAVIGWLVLRGKRADVPERPADGGTAGAELATPPPAVAEVPIAPPTTAEPIARREPAPEPEPEPVAKRAPPAVAAPSPVAPPAVVRPPAPVAAPAPAVAPPAPAPAPPAVSAPPAAPAPARPAEAALRPTPGSFVRVELLAGSQASASIVLQPGAPAGGVPLPLTAPAVEALAAWLAALPALAVPAGEGLRCSSAAGALLRLARLEDGIPLASHAHAATGATTVGQCDPAPAALAAGWLLWATAGDGLLGELTQALAEAKTALTALPPKALGAADAAVKALLQQTGRYLREGQGQYAQVIGKPVFRQRVLQNLEQATAAWASLAQAQVATRDALLALARAPRFGEAQMEPCLQRLRELALQRRAQDAFAGLLAVCARLPVAFGDTAQAASLAMPALADDSPAAVLAEIGAAIEGARVPEYVGKGEFIAHRTTARELLARLGGEEGPARARRFEPVLAALAAGFAGAAAHQLRFDLDAQGHPCGARSLA
jgi:hypothetical protein